MAGDGPNHATTDFGKQTVSEIKIRRGHRIFSHRNLLTPNPIGGILQPVSNPADRILGSNPMATELSWRNLDLDQLTASQRKAYDAYKSAARTAAELREAFEANMNSSLGFGPDSAQRLAFGYKFGKLSVAVAPNDRKASRKPSAPAASLADWLKANALTGARQ